MSLENYYDLSELKNESEKSVFDELEKQLAEKGDSICQCQDCVLDMACLALNHVKPRYRVSLLGSLYAQVEDDSYTEKVEIAVRNAIEIVSANPSHE